LHPESARFHRLQCPGCKRCNEKPYGSSPFIHFHSARTNGIVVKFLAGECRVVADYHDAAVTREGGIVSSVRFRAWFAMTRLDECDAIIGALVVSSRLGSVCRCRRLCRRSAAAS
jgi:hypothetical protein